MSMKYCFVPMLFQFYFNDMVSGHYVDMLITPQVNEDYMNTLEILSKKLKFVEVDSMVKTSKALNDVQPELEKLRQKAVSKVCSK